MAEQLKVHKVLALPTNPEPDSIYFLKDISGRVQSFVTDSFGEIKEVTNSVISINGGSASSIYQEHQLINGGKANGEYGINIE